MSSTRYMAGDKVRVTATFTDNASPANLIDPGGLTLKYRVAGGAAVTKTYPADVVRDSLGVYHYDIDTTGAPGTYAYEFIATGTGQVAGADSFVVLALPV